MEAKISGIISADSKGHCRFCVNAKRWQTVRKAFARLLICEHWDFVAVPERRINKDCEHWQLDEAQFVEEGVCRE